VPGERSWIARQECPLSFAEEIGGGWMSLGANDQLILMTAGEGSVQQISGELHGGSILSRNIRRRRDVISKICQRFSSCLPK
jgi:hypothetical protein